MRKEKEKEREKETIIHNVLCYIIENNNMSYDEALKCYWKLQEHEDIIIEFNELILTGKYPEVNEVQVEGYTAKELSKGKHLSPLGCYSYLIWLRG